MGIIYVKYMRGVEMIGNIMRLARTPFLGASAVSVMVGSAAAWYYTGRFSWLYFILTEIGVVSLHVASNMANDHYDYLSGADPLGEVKPFSGGSQVLQHKQMTVEQSRILFTAFFILGLVMAIYFAVVVGIWALVLGLCGAIIGYAYTVPPASISYKGWGELLIGLAFGPLSVLGSYYVQSGGLSWKPIYVSLPVALLITAVLFINEYPDYKQDKAAAKNNLLVRLGKERGLPLYYILMLLPYIIIIAFIARGILPVGALLTMFTVPLAAKAVITAHRYWYDDEKLMPANASTILCHLSLSALLAIGFIV